MAKENEKVSQDKAVKLGLKNAESIGRRISTNQEQYSIKNVYTKREIIFGRKGLKHSLDASEIHRLRTNARLSAIGAYLVQNAVPINGLKKENQQANGTYAMACFVNDGISIANFLEIVDNTHRSILSNDVLRHLDVDRPSQGHYTNRVLFQKKQVSNRTILSNALESTIDTSTQAGQNELKMLKQYQDKIASIEEQETRLAELNAKIKELSFGKGTDRSKLNELKLEKVKTNNRLNILDKQLMRIEAMKPIRDILEREKEKVRKRTDEKGKKGYF